MWPGGRIGKRYKEGQESIIIGPVIRVIKKKGTTSKSETGSKGRLAVNIIHPCTGLHPDLIRGAVAVVERTGRAPIGQLVGVEDEEEGTVGLFRVCDHTAAGVRLVDAWDEYETFPPERIGGPVIEIRQPNAEKIAELKTRLAGIDADDIAASPAILRLEKEIYDLEHPTEEAPDEWEWPEVIGDE